MAVTAFLATFLLFIGLSKVAIAQEYPFNNVSLPWDERVDDLVSRLTVDEIRDQMAYGGRTTFAPGIPRLGIDPYGWGAECLHGAGQAGPATSFPQAIGLAAIFSPSFHFTIATAIGEEVRSKHNNYSAHGDYGTHTSASCWSPVINILRDPRWGRNQETYGEDPHLTSKLGQAYVRGLQGNHPRYVRANAGCKHFAAYSGPENIPENRLQFNAIVSDRDFRMTYLPAFQKCVEAGTFSIMCSYNSINGVPACGNKMLLTDVLRTEWGFTGYVISDESALENIRLAHNYTETKEETCQLAVRAGCNLEDGPPAIEPEYYSIASAVQMGMLEEAEIREAVKPMFYTRMVLGKFDPPSMNPFATLDPTDYIQSPAHQSLSLAAAMKSFVLLKNEGNLLPLPASTKFNKLAILGPMADNVPAFFGNYAPDPDLDYVVTPLAGVSVLGETVAFAPGCNLSNTRCPTYDKASVIEAATGADFVIIFLGTGRAVESESIDRSDIDLPGHQLELLQDAAEASGNAPILLVLFNAGPLDISWAKSSDRIPAILEVFFPCQTAGEAIRKVILNEGRFSNPAGRLPNTWPMLLSQYPPMVVYNMENRTYRYFNEEPMYPFGYGLSYSRFRYLSLAISPTTVNPNDFITIEVNLINDGPLIGEEVVQVYVKWNDQTLPTPRLQLIGFERYELSVGQVQTAIYQVQLEQLAVWNDDPAGLVVLPGLYTVYAGGQQPNQQTSVPSNILTGSFTIVSPVSEKDFKKSHVNKK